jgi:hypothetical protein
MYRRAPKRHLWVAKRLNLLEPPPQLCRQQRPNGIVVRVLVIGMNLTEAIENGNGFAKSHDALVYIPAPPLTMKVTEIDLSTWYLAKLAVRASEASDDVALR